MKNIIRYIKELFGIYETNHEYWINVKDIKVPYKYRKNKIGHAKWKRKLRYWNRTGNFESKIILNKNFTLIDGYSSLRIAEVKGINQVPVYFVD